MTAFWTALVSALTNYLAAHFGQPFADWFSKIFGKAAEDKPDPEVIRVGFAAAAGPVGDAPPEVITAIKALLVDFVTTSLASKPIIRGIVLAIVKNLPDSFVNKLWDSIFAAQAKMMAAAPIPDADLAACKAEAGIAA